MRSWRSENHDLKPKTDTGPPGTLLVSPIDTTTSHLRPHGGGRRKGAFAVYLEPWHADIFEFLDLRKNHGKEEHRA
ncbi:ribonucleotide-diphosphate reductase subunit rnr1 [Salvia divinorum]|uniref:Ribonucleotide-diphosphate reductase subunit rnr1 n=1 Tax=Salvia divinorum TaxID=28513 RepID=A0ABD1ILJ2_SALDI